MLNLPYCDFTFLTLEIGVHILINRITTSGASIINLQFYPGVDYLTPPPSPKKKMGEIKKFDVFRQIFYILKMDGKIFLRMWDGGD